MTITVEDLLNVSESLLQGQSEAEWRSGTSRAYYAAYHECKLGASELPDTSHFDLRGGTHARLIDQFHSYRTPGSPEGKQSRKIAYILRDLKRRREDADYEIMITLPKSKSETALLMSRALGAEVEALRSLIAKQNIAA